MSTQHNNTLVSFQQDGLELVIDNKTGEVFAGQNALAKMCNCESSDIRKYRGGSELVKSLPVKGLRGGTQIVKLYPEQLIKECLVKFNPELLMKCVDLGLRLYLHTLAGYKITSSAIERPIWLKRLALNPASNIPKGYFSIFNETVIIMARYEEKGFIFPDNLIPDISIGKCWINYLKSNKIEFDRKQYKHNAPNPHIPSVDVWCYNLDLLGIFRKWYDAEYEPVKLLPYINDRIPMTHEIVAKMLDLPLLN